MATENLYKFETAPKESPLNLAAKSYILDANELAKTLFLTFLILGFQIALFLGLRNHLIRIPGVSY